MKKTTVNEASSNIRTVSYGDQLPHIDSLVRILPEPDGTLPEEESGSGYRICYSARDWQTWHVGQRFCFLPRDHFLLVKPGENLSPGERCGPDSRILQLQFSLPPEREESSFLGFTREERAGLFFLLGEMTSPVIRTGEDSSFLMESIYLYSREMAEDTQDKPLITVIRLKNLLRNLFLALSEGQTVFSGALDSLIDSILPRFPEGGYSPLIEKAIGHMSENLYEGLTLVSLADDVNISLSRFKARFKEETGITPLDYYTRLSIQKSLELLHISDQSVRSIAEDLGFSSVRYFTSLFKKHVGMVPGEFRQWEGRRSASPISPGE